MVSLSQAYRFLQRATETHRSAIHRTACVAVTHWFGTTDRYSAPVCDDVLLRLLCGEHNQFQDWLTRIESLGSNPDECATVKKRIDEQVRQRK